MCSETNDEVVYGLVNMSESYSSFLDLVILRSTGVVWLSSRWDKTSFAFEKHGQVRLQHPENHWSTFVAVAKDQM